MPHFNVNVHVVVLKSKQNGFKNVTDSSLRFKIVRLLVVVNDEHHDQFITMRQASELNITVMAWLLKSLHTEEPNNYT